MRKLIRKIDEVLFFGIIRKIVNVIRAIYNKLLFYVLAPFLFVTGLLLLKSFASRKVLSGVTKTEKPRLFWGCHPVTNNKYASQAMAQKGYVSKTFVGNYYSIAVKEDYDLYRYELFGIYRYLSRSLVSLIEPYFSFIYLLFRFDIFHFFYDGGILARTPLRFYEIQLLHFFNKKVVVMPYGGDVHVIQAMRNNVYKFGQLYHYKSNAVYNIDQIRSWIDYFSKHADFCIGMINFDALYRYDILPVSYISIDCDQWSPPDGYQYINNGKDGPVAIVHSPNHRMIKGTDYIIAAVDRLKQDGYKIEFHLLEGLKNTDVERVLKESDILVELLVCGYGLSGMEGMAVGKPVISNFQTDTSVLRYYSYFEECPIVQADIDTVYEKLKWLIENPSIRKKIGEASRRYVEKYHSYLSQQIMWGQIYKQIWYGEEVDLMLLYHPLHGIYSKLYYEALMEKGRGEGAVATDLSTHKQANAISQTCT